MFFKNKFLIQILVIVFFANISFAQQDKMNELLDRLEKIQKDIQTLEKAVYSKNAALPSDNVVVNEALTRQLAKISELEKLPEAIRTRVLRIFAISSGVHPGPFSFEHIEAIDALVKNWHGQGNVDLPGFIQATRVDGSLRFVASKH